MHTITGPLSLLCFAALLVSCSDGAAAGAAGGPTPTGGQGGATSSTTGAGGGGGAAGAGATTSSAGGAPAACDPSSPATLVACVDQARYQSDLVFIAEPRTSDTAHWQAVQDLCADRLTAYGFTVERHDYGTGINVVGVLPGNVDASHQVVIGAHYDSVADCPGADDNASGVAGALEAARVLATSDHARTLVVACWDEEEKGLIGSKAWAARANSQGELVDAYFNFEMIAYKDEAEGSQKLPAGFGIFFPAAEAKNNENGKRANFIAAIGDPGSSAPLAALQKYSDSIGLLFMPLQLSALDLANPLLADLQRSDHAAFWNNGYPAMMITDTSNFRYAAYHCSNGLVDAVENLDHAFATQVVQATVGAAAEALALTADP